MQFSGFFRLPITPQTRYLLLSSQDMVRYIPNRLLDQLAICFIRFPCKITNNSTFHQIQNDIFLERFEWSFHKIRFHRIFFLDVLIILFTCIAIEFQELFPSMNLVSPVRLSCGIGIFGTGHFKNSQIGSHPSFTFHIRRSSFGTF